MATIADDVIIVTSRCVRTAISYLCCPSPHIPSLSMSPPPPPPPNLSSPSQPDQGHDWEGGPISTQCHTSTLCHYRRKHVALLSSILYLQPSLFSCSLIFSSLSLFPLSSFPPPSSPLFTSFLSPPSLVLLFFFFLLFPFSFLPVSTSLSAFLPHCFISLSLSDDDDTSYWTLHEASYCW